ncbi:hypothetical protein AAFF_G00389330 [Aldrovandia affinis]|uniref:Uncharacterized protein n=1 Tax=Aldrovandia affinis TaxID=143900 RepID=A0AAD7WL35_9TELE|nr:hypothetical protein AAFF_G00389330 [Aldrovandia affinis]
MLSPVEHRQHRGPTRLALRTTYPPCSRSIRLATLLRHFKPVRERQKLEESNGPRERGKKRAGGKSAAPMLCAPRPLIRLRPAQHEAPVGVGGAQRHYQLSYTWAVVVSRTREAACILSPGVVHQGTRQSVSQEGGGSL